MNRFSPLYCAYNGILLGQFSALAFVPACRDGYEARRQRMQEFLDEVGADLRMPVEPPAWGSDAHQRLHDRIWREVHAQAPRLLDFTSLGYHMLVYGIFQARRDPIARLSAERILRIARDHDLPPPRLADLVPQIPRRGDVSIDAVLAPSLRYLTSIVQQTPVERDTAFVIMPFSAPYSGYFATFYRPTLEKAGYRAFRAWGGLASEDYCILLLRLIERCGLAWADVSGGNENVYYELGAAHAFGKPSVIVVHEKHARAIPSNIQHDAVLPYAPMSLRWPRDTIALVAATMRKMGLTVGPASRVRRAAMNEALDHLDGPFARDPSKAATRAFERACRLLETGDLRSAEALSTRAIKLGYANNQTYTVRAVARLGRGRYRLAVADLDETLRRDPGRVELLRMRATAFSNLDLAARADDDFSAVLAQTPDDAEAWSFRGIVRAAQGRLAEAEADFKQAERRGCHSVAMDQWRVYVLSRLGRLKRARALLQRARKADPRAALTLRVEGDVHMAAGNYEDAVVAYRRALTRRRGAEFRFALALALLKTGRKPEARRTFAVARRQARPSDLDEARREANHWLSSADERQEVLDALTVSPGRATRAVATG